MPTETLRAFVERNRDRYPIPEPFPFKALEKLARRTVGETEIVLLLALLDLVGRYDDRTDPEGRSAYEGQDLRRKAEVVAALGGCGDAHAGPIADWVTTLFRSVMHKRSYATPGSPDPDKFDRDSLVESSEDALALACIRVLARLDIWSVESRSALSDARRHRSAEVAELAGQMMTHLAAHE